MSKNVINVDIALADSYYANGLPLPQPKRSLAHLKMASLQRHRKIMQVVHEELERFVVNDVQWTGVALGAGSYCSVEEVEVSGTTIAAKKLHAQLIDLGSPQVNRDTSQ